MGRWEPDARGRLMRSALELYAERGFEQTTAAEIAERAGVTERTFFRHFADKREVLFLGSKDLQNFVIDTIENAPAGMRPMDIVSAAMISTATVLTDREHSRVRGDVIAANPSLQERELLKLARLADAIAEALRERGVSATVAALAAETGVAIFKVGFEAWIGGQSSPDFAGCMRLALDELRSLTVDA